MGLRVHANQLGPSGGVALACELGAASADHCTHLTRADIDALAGSDTVATLLPISDFCTRQPYPDGRALLDAGATVAVASNCNPGSSYSTSIPLALALAVRECGLTIDEALLAATRGGAAALRRPDIGRLVPGARADAVVLDAPHPQPPGATGWARRSSAGGPQGRRSGLVGTTAIGPSRAPARAARLTRRRRRWPRTGSGGPGSSRRCRTPGGWRSPPGR